MTDRTAALDAASVPTSRSARVRAILGGCAGNLVEWFDWFTYSSFSLYFARHFFPSGDQTAQLLQAAAVFGVGFLARPIGAWAMGLYADHAGRKTALATSVAMMCGGSFAVAILPGHETIGALAPAGLVAARILQGLSVGGEYGAAATYMSEMAGRKRRGLLSSLQMTTVVVGQLLALGLLILLQQTMPAAALEAWGWRIPFAIGGLLAVIVFWLRTGMDESASFEAARQGRERGGALRLLKEYPRETWAVFVLTAAGSVAFYVYTTYMQKFLVNTAGFSRETATALTAAALVVYLVAQPLVGALSDRVGRRAPLALGFALGALFTYPAMTALGRTHSPALAFALITGLMVIVSGYTAVNAAVKSELYPAYIRALGVALPYAMASAIFGGTAEYAALWFKQAGMENGFFLYVSGVMLVAMVVALRLRDSARHSLILED
jgi:MHS family alpha-ketoglutarate permease-like MFS transporter